MFFTTGAEAIENAVKIARAATGRPGVIAFTGGYHGRTLMTLGLTGKVSPYKQKFGPFPSDIFRAPFPNALHGISVEDALAALDLLFRTDADPERIAAMVIEPVQGEGGYYIAPFEFLQELRRICDQRGILLIADEIQSGFARAGKWFAIEHSGVVPDLIAVAKSLAGGFPLAGVIGRAEIMDAVPPGGLGGTYAGNPVACAAAIAAVQAIEERAARAELRARGADRRTPAGDRGQQLAALHRRGARAGRHGVVRAGQGSIDGRAEPGADGRLTRKAAENGLILSVLRPLWQRRADHGADHHARCNRRRRAGHHRALSARDRRRRLRRLAERGQSGLRWPGMGGARGRSITMRQCMVPFAIAGIQMTVSATQSNLAAMTQRVDVLMHRFPWVQMVLFSELCVLGPLRSTAQPLPGPTEQAFCELAARHGIWLVPGSLFERVDDRVYNTAPVINPEGRWSAATARCSRSNPTSRASSRGTSS